MKYRGINVCVGCARDSGWMSDMIYDLGLGWTKMTLYECISSRLERWS